MNKTRILGWTLLAFIIFTGLLGVTLPKGFMEGFILKTMGLD